MRHLLIVPLHLHHPHRAQDAADKTVRIVRAAARRFRRRGSEGAGIGDLMRDLRLTHGGFYRHFDSKERLFAEAFEHSLKEVGDRVIQAIERAAPGGELKIFGYVGQGFAGVVVQVRFTPVTWIPFCECAVPSMIAGVRPKKIP